MALKNKGPRDTLQWLSNPDVIRHLGAKRAAALRQKCLRDIERAETTGVSEPRIAAELAGGEPVRVSGMILSRGAVRYGDGPATRRWTPPNAVGAEDRYDLMDAIEAAHCLDPSSQTGIQFQQIEMRNARIKRPKKKPRRRGSRWK